MSVERERTLKEREIYYLPGMGGRLNAGLGKELFQRGFALTGRETVGTFKKLRFGQQIDAVKQDLVEQFWSPGSRVIANSFGGYLFLHAQLGLAPFPGSGALTFSNHWFLSAGQNWDALLSTSSRCTQENGTNRHISEAL